MIKSAISRKETLNVAIASIGRFHMFDLARQMTLLGQNTKLYSGYPQFKVDRDLQKIARTHSWMVLIEQVRNRGWWPPKNSWWSDRTLEDFGRWLARCLKEKKVDILDAIAGTGLEAGRLLRERGIPWICNRASTHILTQKQLLEEEYARWNLPPIVFSTEGIDRCLAEYREANAVVVPSEFTKRSFLEQGYPPARLFKAPFGVDLKLFSPCKRAEGEKRRFTAVFLGQISIRKGIGYFLEAMSDLHKKGLAESWLIGPIDPIVLPLLKKYSGEFIYQGVVPRPKLDKLLSRCDVLILPSIEEGLALVQAQAMACGLPIIVTANTGAEDLIVDGREGFIVPIRDPSAIREKVIWLLDNPSKKAEMSEAALLKVKRMGGWSSYGQRCLDIYHTILQGKL